MANPKKESPAAQKPSPKALAEAKAKFQQALTLHRAGRTAQAVWLYEQVLKLHPTHLEALQMLGVLMFQGGKMEQGTELLRQVVAIDPGQAAGHNNLGNALRELGQHEAALASFDRAIALKPDFVDALSNRGNALNNLHRHQQALASYDQALALHPNHVNALNNRGTALFSLKRFEEALDSYNRSIALNPNIAETYLHRGAALLGLDQFLPALESCDRAIALNPTLVGAYNNKATAFKSLRQYQAAALTYSKILELEPGRPYAKGEVMNAMLRGCDWSNYADMAQEIRVQTVTGALRDQPFFFLAISSSAAEQLVCTTAWAQDLYPQAATRLWNGEKYDHPKIRLAYLSADFNRHATAYLMAELFEMHSRDRFELTAYSFGPATPSPMRTRLENAFDHFIDVTHLDDLQVAQLMREHEIDIAVDLKGFTGSGRTGIFTHRPAPVQVNYLGYPGSMGAPYMDYILGDNTVTPPEHDAFYSEKVVRLPHSYQVNDRKRVIAEHGPSRAECGLPETGFVFCCFNNNYKITPQVFGIWMRLLQEVPHSVLWLLEDNVEASANLREEAARRGISAERLVFANRMDLPMHLARHRHADLFLDTLPCNAHTTASDALWAGLPVVTRTGDSFAGRVAASLLRAVGLPELVTDSAAGYEQLALELATHPERLAEVKARLVGNLETCALFDTDRYCRNLEAAYTTMYERSQQGLPPESFSAPDRT